MMVSFSPFTRKLVAVGLLILAVLTTINLLVVPVASTLHDRLADLADARLRRVRLEVLGASAPLPIVPAPQPGLAFHAVDAPHAGELMGATLREAAVRTGATMTMAPAQKGPTTSPSLAFDIIATGPEEAIVGLVNQLEQAEPVIRFAQWKIAAGATADAPLKLEARALAAWTQQ